MQLIEERDGIHIHYQSGRYYASVVKLDETDGKWELGQKQKKIAECRNMQEMNQFLFELAEIKKLSSKIIQEIGETYCPISGEKINRNFNPGMGKAIVDTCNVSFGTGFWIKRIYQLGEQGKENWFIIEQNHYFCRDDGIAKGITSDGKEVDRSPRPRSNSRGWDGQVFRITKGGISYVIDDMWDGGKAPAWVEKYLPDNATWTPKKQEKEAGDIL